MAAYAYPGVYIEELSSGVHTITGVATSITAFIGWAPKGQSPMRPWCRAGRITKRSSAVWSAQLHRLRGQPVLRQRRPASIYCVPGTECYHSAGHRCWLRHGADYRLPRYVSGAISQGVETPALQSITITPAVMSPMPIGATVALVASPLRWRSESRSRRGKMDYQRCDSGFGHCRWGGNGSWRRTSGSISGSTAIKVTAANFSTLTVTLSTLWVAVGQTLQLSANASCTDGTTQDVTASVVWSSSTPPTPRSAAPAAARSHPASCRD